MKVCFILSKAYPLFNKKNSSTFGGSELQLYLLAKEISKDENFSVSFLVGDYNQDERENYRGVEVFRGVNLNKAKSFFSKFIAAFRLYKILKKINADVYLFSTANPFLGLLSFFCRMNNKKVIFRTASDIDCNLRFIKDSGILGRIYRYGLENSDIVLTQNEQHKKLLKKNHGISAIILKNSIQIPEKRIAGMAKKRILWVSSCQKLKRPELFLDLAKKYPNEKFIMVCPPSIGSGRYWKHIDSKSKGVENLEFVNYVHFSDIQKYFNNAKVFVNTSDFEGFPNTFLQAGIAGTPILSLKVNPDNFIEEYNCGYC